jgi:hypothetical protein
MQSSIYKLFFTKINEGTAKEQLHVSRSYRPVWKNEITYVNHTIISDKLSEDVLIYKNLLTVDYFSKKYKLV